MSIKESNEPMDHLLGMVGQGSDKYITDMEKRGQRQLVASMLLPTDRCHDIAVYEALGFKFDTVDPRDNLFQEVSLPPGWKKVRTDHAMWSKIIDEKDRERASIFYKAAFYDRRANMRLAPRFLIGINYDRDDYDTTREMRILDGRSPILSLVEETPLKDGKTNYELQNATDKRLFDAAKAWLLERVPRVFDDGWQLTPECWAFEVPVLDSTGTG